MTNTASATPKSTAKKPTPSAPRTAPKPAAEPSLRFFHSEALRTQTDAVLAALEAWPALPKQGDAMADLVAQLVEAGMDYYFLRPLTLAKVGFMTEQSARLSLSGAVRLINSVSRKFIVRMDAAQLQVVAAHIKSLT